MISRNRLQLVFPSNTSLFNDCSKSNTNILIHTRAYDKKYYHYKDNNYKKNNSSTPFWFISTTSFALTASIFISNADNSNLFDLPLNDNEELKKQLRVNAKNMKLSKKDIRFLLFASIEYDEVIYMTPSDFLDCLTQDHPKERVFRRVLDEKTVNEMLKRTPSFSQNEDKLFRKIDSNGLISYSEYLFLIMLLTKNKNEFLLVRSLVTPLRSRSKKQELEEQASSNCSIDGENIAKIMQYIDGSVDKNFECEGEGYSKSTSEITVQETTLSKYLFGQKGNQKRSFNDFRIFFEQLQKELTEIEFNEFSRGKNEISPVDLARLVLRYSILNKGCYEEYLKRIQSRTCPGDPGITFSEFEQFSKFLNHLEDFTKAVRLYTSAQIAVSEEEFIRAVKVTTNLELSKKLVHILFLIFDENGDGHLTYTEFIAVMNDRLNRGFKKRNKGTKGLGWEFYKDCIINEVRN
ncbi:Calcium uptake protein 2, mitochondrial [Strongyloides ratti]|uniref:Calcium uptake protein 2, mitochondrial n=1 Tax=Strongyloides ratti TaxID=34506 RepID=A0A090L9I4_STRRB|nr:Calcium uptake protein 2, mitochondrial [Strongyloides ratti]CEF66412.1 Calcium uptake protein 2, mitochondrial [Strongyloides ratti]